MFLSFSLSLFSLSLSLFLSLFFSLSLSHFFFMSILYVSLYLQFHLHFLYLVFSSFSDFLCYLISHPMISSTYVYFLVILLIFFSFSYKPQFVSLIRSSMLILDYMVHYRSFHYHSSVLILITASVSHLVQTRTRNRRKTCTYIHTHVCMQYFPSSQDEQGREEGKVNPYTHTHTHTHTL